MRREAVPTAALLDESDALRATRVRGGSPPALPPLGPLLARRASAAAARARAAPRGPAAAACGAEARAFGGGAAFARRRLRSRRDRRRAPRRLPQDGAPLPRL